MLTWISENIATIIICVILLVVVAAIISKMVRDKKNGKSIQCGGDCKNCGGHCH